MHNNSSVQNWRYSIQRLAILLFILIGLFYFLSWSIKPKPILRVATDVWTGYESFYLARSLGYYDNAPIRLVEMTSTSQKLHAIRNGTIDAVALTLDETLYQIQDHNFNIKIVLVIDISNGADALLAKPTIKNLVDLRNKKIGFENTASSAIVFDAAIEHVGININEVKIVPLRVNEHLLAWKKNEVDAVVTFEPMLTELLNLGGHVLFDSAQIPGRIMDVLVVRTEVLEQHQEALKTLIAGHFAALKYLNENPKDASERMTGRLSTRVEQILPQFKLLKQPNLEENLEWLSGAKPALHKTATDLSQLMFQHQLLQHRIAIDNLCDAKFLSPNIP